MVFGCEIDGIDVVNSWYSEVKDYDFSKFGFQLNIGYFMQVVWKGSKELGIGRVKSVDGKEFVVGCYRLVGNMMRVFVENVFLFKVCDIYECFECLIQKFFVLLFCFKFFDIVLSSF